MQPGGVTSAAASTIVSKSEGKEGGPEKENASESDRGACRAGLMHPRACQREEERERQTDLESDREGDVEREGGWRRPRRCRARCSREA